jgi:trehalose-phosphatase
MRAPRRWISSATVIPARRNPDRRARLLDRSLRAGLGLVLDFDGTLAPITRRPSSAHLPSSTRAVLRELARRVPCAILSGRARKDLRRIFHGVPVRYLVGNHGLEWGARGEGTGPSRRRVLRWKSWLTERLPEVPGARVEDKRHSLSVHYRRSPDPARARLQLACMLRGLDGARVVEGRMVFNLLPGHRMDKGTALLKLGKLLRAPALAYVGDDITDEAAFRAARTRARFLSFKVRNPEVPARTRARYTLATQSRVRPLLREILARSRLVALAALYLMACGPGAQSAVSLDKLRLPPGFTAELFASVPGARQLALGEGGTVFVGSKSGGKVYAVAPGVNGGATRVHVVASGLDMPNGVAVRGGHLYVAEKSRILRYDGIEKRLTDPPKPAVLTDKLPQASHHGWKFIAFGPDGWLYVPVGAPCNVCETPQDARYATILRMRPEGGELQPFSHGVRNTVGFDWHPKTGELWFTDNGRDWLGDDAPPDELNRAPRAGMDFGFPGCHGRGIRDPEFGARKPCAGTAPPELELGAHVAALGMRFYRGSSFPAAYRGQILMAEHGSWNRSKPSGYRVTRVTLREGAPPKVEPFVEGFLQGEEAWGRPVDVLELPDGSVLVSDDHAGAIYRIRFKG